MDERRTLFIGLGGTGGKVIRRLYKRMTPEQRLHASYLYMDLDQKDINQQMEQGIEAVRISSADTVEEVAMSLGIGDGVYDWLPARPDEDEGVFRSEQMEDGAGQIRYKSRLCIARLLKDENNHLNNALRDLSIVGAGMENTPLRVMIVSSIAGGTGAGSFLDIALYVRKFFRDHKQEIMITGLFACPELFARVQDDDGKRMSMYANAYAAIRELNAMNIAVSGSKNVSNDYGKSINMAISTRSEGKLFDSRESEFTDNFNTKPFNLLYFLDEYTNTGGILPSLNEYYEVMADIAYTRLYSPLAEDINSDESNEVDAHIEFPTAIYGGAGYGKIIYPYEDILRYLAEKRVSEDLGIKWTYCERDWATYCYEQEHAAAEDGATWTPSPQEREQHFVSCVDQALLEKTSPLHFIKDMIQTDENDRVDEYVSLLMASGTTSSGLTSDKTADGKFGFGSKPEIQDARRNIINTYETSKVDETDPLKSLSEMANSLQPQLMTYCSLVASEVPKRARLFSSAVFSTIDTEGKNITGSSEVGLHTGLLRKDKKDIHPIASRYLLYKLRSVLRSKIDLYNKQHGQGGFNLIKHLEKTVRLLDLAFDDDPFDSDEIRIANAVERLGRKMTYKIKIPFSAKKGYIVYIDEYKKQFRETMVSINKDATDHLLYLTYTNLMESLDVLISQYEGFFENLEQFETKLKQKANSDEIAHDRARTRYIYVGASANMKKYYYSKVSYALAEGDVSVYAAEGKGIYKALEERVIAYFKKKREQAMMSRHQFEEKKDDYSDLSLVFDEVVDTYADVLRERASYLQADVVTAIVHQTCQKLGLDESVMHKDASARNRFNQEFRAIMKDLIAKSRALISYEPTILEDYFQDEKEILASKKKDVSKEYKYVAIGQKTAENLTKIFPAEGTDPLDASLAMFQKVADLEKTPIIGKSFSPYEIVCFSAVHCLQPTQISKFNENRDFSYYHQYVKKLKEAIATNTLSRSPHIDKRWHRRGVMPYISRNLELKWRKQLMQAFLYLMLVREIQFTTDNASGRRCFIYRRGGQQLFLQWPGNKIILQQNISRILELLAEDEALVNQCEAEMKDTVDYQIELLSNFTGNKALYKSGLTKNLLMERLRSNTMASFGKDEAKEKGDIDAQVDGEAGIKLSNASNTLGGILQIAWLVHQSEENLGEDRDYGEALLDAAADIIDRFCQAMYGNDRIENTGTQAYRDYVELYNTEIVNVLKAYVMAQPVKAGEQKPDELKRSKAIFTDENLTRPGGAGNDFAELNNVPESVRSSDAYNWITANWHKKGVL